jgi:hypothetical protein
MASTTEANIEILLGFIGDYNVTYSTLCGKPLIGIMIDIICNAAINSHYSKQSKARLWRGDCL